MFSNLIVKNMAIFQQLEWQQHQRLNLIIGENDTGKTILLKLLYCIAKSIEESQKLQNTPSLSWQNVLADKLRWTFQPPALELSKLVHQGESQFTVTTQWLATEENSTISFTFDGTLTQQILKISPSSLSHFATLNVLFLPSKEILTVIEAIDATRTQLQIIGFDDTYIDLINALRLPISKEILPNHLQKALELLEIQMGKWRIEVEQNEFIFKRGQEKYIMSQTAEGFKKIGILERLIHNRMLNPNSILFLDEPEMNLHPRAIITLVDTLFQLAKAGIQIYLATHSYFVIKRFEWLARKHNESIPLCSLSRHQTHGISAKFHNLRDGIPSNPIIEVSIELYEQDVLLDFE